MAWADVPPLGEALLGGWNVWIVPFPSSERMKLGLVCDWLEDVGGTRLLIHEDGEEAGVALEVEVARDGGALPETGST